MDGITVPTVDAVTGLTTFETEVANTEVAFKGDDASGTLPYVDEYQDVKQFFARPRMNATFTAATARNILYNSDILTGGGVDPVNKYWPASAANRLNGILGYRCTIKYTLTCSATPFQQGVVALSWQYGAFTGTNAPTCRTQFAQMCTNVHHVRLDVSDSTMAELSVPYVSQTNYFDFANSVAAGGDNVAEVYGNCSVIQILPYATITSSTAPTFRMYVSLHDMELFGAVPVALNSVIIQGGLTAAMNKESAKLSDTCTVSLPTVSGVPKLSDVTTAVSWAAAKATSLAKSFGYSKPVDERTVERRLVTGYAHDSHVDQPSEAFTIAPFQSNRITVDGSHYPEAVDEMALDYVLGVYNQCFLGTISTSDTSGTIIYGTNVCPTSFWFRTNSSRPGGNIGLPVSSTLTTNAFMPTGICYISQMFRRWRGSIKLRISFGKTKFHAGRVLLSFIPATFDTNVEATLSNPVPAPEVSGSLVQPFQYSTIFDLKDSNVVEFDIPYISSRHWLSTLGSIGGFTMTILDPLITTGETASTISFLMEVKAGPDYQLANFIGNGLVPAHLLNPSSTLAFLQSGLTTKVDDATPYTSGECFSSLKQVIQIPSYVTETVNDSIVNTLPPWSSLPTLLSGIAIPLPVATSIGGSLANGCAVASMYAFVSGGTEYHTYTASNAQLSLQQSTIEGGAAYTSIAKNNPRRRNTYSKPRVIAGSTDSGQHYKFPSYQRSPLIPTKAFSFEATAFQNGTFTFNELATSSLAQLTTIGQSSFINVTVGYAASDDARCHCYIGPPPCLLFQSTQTAEPDAFNGLVR